MALVIAAEIPAVWTVIPFILLLSCIAVLPLLAGHWWHKNHNKGIVALLLSLPVVAYFIYLEVARGEHALENLGHAAVEYILFITMLGSLYTVTGGITLHGDLPPRPVTNTALLAVGAVLANLIGTTGASMLLIRPLLRINAQRQHQAHLPVFFIFVVGNLGGLLTPLGDPPLFLGFIDGVPFFWTLTLWPHWLLANLCVLAIFYAWDALACRRETPQPAAPSPAAPFRIEGGFNVLFLAGILGAVLLQGELAHPWRDVIPPTLMFAMAVVSLWCTPRKVRQQNGFTWFPIVEVAVLFAGIFVAMVPALQYLGANEAAFGITEPWHYFWLTGSLSSFLDNAPTYLTFATMARGEPNDLGWLAANQPHVLEAISAGAVFMGALTYIGNGPNFMVKAIADEAGYPVPSFFGYMGYALVVLLPVLVLVTVVFFRPG
jgi:Na+/H+ antiporter NhaD/arsenite permease-like protein